VHIRVDTVTNVRDEPQEIGAIDGRVAEAFTLAVPMRVETAAADLHHLAVPALRAQRGGADLPGHRGGMVKRVIEAVRCDVQAGVGGAWVGGTERVELFDRSIGIDDGDRAWQEP